MAVQENKETMRPFSGEFDSPKGEVDRIRAREAPEKMARGSIFKRHSVTTFFVLSYAIGLGMLVPALVTGVGLFALIAASSSSIAALITAAITGGTKSVKQLLSGFVRWRSNPWWYALAVLMPAAISLLGFGLAMAFGGRFQIQWTVGWAMLIPTFVLITLQAGLGEEIGWRGFATPKLMEKHSALASSLIVGVVWAAWHLPLYFVPGMVQNNMVHAMGFPLTLVIFSSNVIAFAVVLAWMFVKTKGNLWLPVLIHGSINSFDAFFALGSFGVYGLAPMTISAGIWVAVALAIAVPSLARLRVESNRTIVSS